LTTANFVHIVYCMTTACADPEVKRSDSYEKHHGCMLTNEGWPQCCGYGLLLPAWDCTLY